MREDLFASKRFRDPQRADAKALQLANVIACGGGGEPLDVEGPDAHTTEAVGPRAGPIVVAHS